jgi:NADH-quinone oxidoreductase subunit L
MATVMTVLSWCYLYMRAHGRTVRMPGWITRQVEGGRNGLYVLFMNRLYVDELYDRIGGAIMRLVHRLDKPPAR